MEYALFCKQSKAYSFFSYGHLTQANHLKQTTFQNKETIR